MEARTAAFFLVSPSIAVRKHSSLQPALSDLREHQPCAFVGDWRGARRRALRCVVLGSLRPRILPLVRSLCG